MSSIQTVTTSLRSARMRALAPRLLATALVLILCIAGLRSILEGPTASPARAAGAGLRAQDPAAQSFAEGFARAYLSWDSSDPQAHVRALEPYLPSSMDADGGLTPGAQTSQDVSWTAVMAVGRSGSRLEVAVTAQTTNGPAYLSVPVARDRNGYLFVAGYPALLGAPPVRRDPRLPHGDEVSDEGLRTVVKRAIGNYLSGARQNLLADLTPDAAVALPPRPMTLTSVDGVTWIAVNRRVAVELAARDSSGTAWRLRYELDVRNSDRWYVRRIHVNPTLQGGG